MSGAIFNRVATGRQKPAPSQGGGCGGRIEEPRSMIPKYIGTARFGPIARRSQAGFTLVEAICTIVILSALGVGLYGVMINVTNGYTSASVTAQLHSELSISLDRITRELHNIPVDSGASGLAPDIDSVTASSIAWGGNNSLSLSGSDLMLTISGGTAAVLLGDVTAFTVQAYNESNSALSATLSGTGCDPIRRVLVTVTLARHGITETLRTKVFLRCTVSGAEN